MNTTHACRVGCLGVVLLACLAPRAIGQCLEWQDVTGSGTRPPQASEHAVVYDSCRGVIVHFGGFLGTTGTDHNETWEWTCPTHTWIKRTPATSPTARHSHGMAFDSVRCRTVLFGGSQTNSNSDDTWEYDGSTWTQKFPTTSPPPRIAHGMAYDASRQRVVLFGGHQDGGTRLNDTWEWNGTTWVDVTPASGNPSIREYPAMGYDSDCQKTLLFGGQPPLFEDTWMWDGSTWVKLSQSGPSSRYAAAMSYDAVRQKMVLFGGNTGSGSNETWEWTWSGGCASGAWTQVSTTTQPDPRFHIGTAFSESCSKTVLFGGWVSVTDRRDDTWVYPSVDNVDCNHNGLPDSCDAPIPDQDNDGIGDPCDNCVSVANANQSNLDGDAFGDVCDQCPFDPTNTKVEGQCIPTLSEWGMMAMAGLVVLAGGVVIKRRQKAVGIRQ